MGVLKEERLRLLQGGGAAVSIDHRVACGLSTVGCLDLRYLLIWPGALPVQPASIPAFALNLRVHAFDTGRSVRAANRNKFKRGSAAGVRECCFAGRAVVINRIAPLQRCGFAQSIAY